MSFGFRAEVGYNAAKDVTFLRTNTADFNDQLTIPVSRDSKEDLAIRELLEEQEIVDFDALKKAVVMPDFCTDEFGMVGTEEDSTLTPIHYDHVVLFGKEGSGAVNLIRFWILWAIKHNIHIVSVANPGLYGMEKHINNNLVHHLDESLPLEEQFDDTGVLDVDNPRVLLLVGANYEPVTCTADDYFISKVQKGEYEDDMDNSVEVFSLIHHEKFPEEDDFFFGAESDFNKVSYAAIGDVNAEVASMVGADVPTHNPRGVAWFSLKGGESKRVRTYVVPRPFVKQLEGRVAYL